MNAPHWQNSLEPQFVRRLTRPLWQPGITDRQLADTILVRSERFNNRLSLLNQQLQRWGQNHIYPVDQVPIVYAQPSQEDAIATTRSVSPPQSLPLEFPEVHPSSPSLGDPISASTSLPTRDNLELIKDSFSTADHASGDRASESPVVTPRPNLSNIETSGAMLLQTKLDPYQTPITATKSSATRIPGTKEILSSIGFSRKWSRLFRPSQLSSPPSSDLATDEKAIATLHSLSSSHVPPLKLVTAEKAPPLPVIYPTLSAASSALFEGAERIQKPFSQRSTEHLSKRPLITSMPVPLRFETLGAMPLQAKFDHSESLNADTQGAAIPISKPNFPNEFRSFLYPFHQSKVRLSNTVDGRSAATAAAVSLPSFPPPLQLPVVHSALLTASPSAKESSAQEVTDPSKESLPDRATQPASEPPIVTPQPALMGFDTTGAMPLQTKLETSSGRSSSASALPPLATEKGGLANRLPIVSAQPMISQSAIAKLPRSNSPAPVRETSHRPDSVPLVAAEPIDREAAIAPLVFSTPNSGTNPTEFSQARAPTQFTLPPSEEWAIRAQETAVSSFGMSSPADSSPFQETQVNQNTTTPQSQPVDLEAMAAKVERRLLRRLAIESERRGQHRWGLKS